MVVTVTIIVLVGVVKHSGLSGIFKANFMCGSVSDCAEECRRKWSRNYTSLMQTFYEKHGIKTKTK